MQRKYAMTNNNNNYPYLDRVDSPADLKNLDRQEIQSLCRELREFLIASVAETGGHLGASLGTVELTLALHYVYNTPDDLLVWDVGHQTYPHKILTGRKNRMHTMRKRDGLAGFPTRSESPYDTFGVGHSSTSISAALGMALGLAEEPSSSSENKPEPAEAVAENNQTHTESNLDVSDAHSSAAAPATNNDARRVVAIIGDGALTAGLAYEALNHAGGLRSNMLVILNDNDMSISPNVGAMNKYLARILTGKFYSGARESGKRILSKLPSMIEELARRTEEHLKGMVVPCTLFEELGFNYFGPVDGHDLDSLIDVLVNLRRLNGPLFLHVVTRKGKGYPFAEKDALALHAVTPFNPETGKALSSGSGAVTYTKVFGNWLCDMAESNPELVAITPAMREGSGMVEFEQRFPDRYFDVGIAEQHAVTLAAGLACVGKKPVVAIYSTFLQRAYDQLVHDVALQNLPVMFAIDRAGLVGPDGATHAGSFDLTYMRCLPNMVLMAPADENECRLMLNTGYAWDGPSAVRYPRGSGPGIDVVPDSETLEIGRAEIRREGNGGIALLAFGSMVTTAEAIAAEFDATVVNMRFIKPLDQSLLTELANNHKILVTIEENTVSGGAGTAVIEFLAASGLHTPVQLIGLPDEFVEHGSREELIAYCKLDEEGLHERIMKIAGCYLNSHKSDSNNDSKNSGDNNNGISNTDVLRV